MTAHPGWGRLAEVALVVTLATTAFLLLRPRLGLAGQRVVIVVALAGAVAYACFRLL